MNAAVERDMKQIIVDKIDEITKEYQVICINHSNDIDYINLCSHQYNSMKQVLEEILNEIEEDGGITQ